MSGGSNENTSKSMFHLEAVNLIVIVRCILFHQTSKTMSVAIVKSRQHLVKMLKFPKVDLHYVYGSRHSVHRQYAILLSLNANVFFSFAQF